MEPADYGHISLEVDEGIATITLDRPDRMNAFTERMRVEILDALDRTDADDDVRAVIFTGSGRAYCAGADLSSGEETFSRGGSPVIGANGVPRDGGGTVALRIFESLKPVIGAINGAAVGVGVTMTLPMDARLASTTARFGFVFARQVGEEVTAGLELLGVEAADHIQFIIDALRPHAEELGLAGAPTAG